MHRRPSLSAGNTGLALRAVKLSGFAIATVDLGFAALQKEYKLENSKAYRLKIVSTGRHEYDRVAPEFFDFIRLSSCRKGVWWPV